MGAWENGGWLGLSAQYQRWNSNPPFSLTEDYPASLSVCAREIWKMPENKNPGEPGHNITQITAKFVTISLMHLSCLQLQLGSLNCRYSTWANRDTGQLQYTSKTLYQASKRAGPTVYTTWNLLANDGPYIIMDRLCPTKLIYYSKWRVFHNVYLPQLLF